MYDVENLTQRREGTCGLSSCKELKVHLLRNRTLTFGKAPFEDGLSRRNTDLDSPIAMQLDDNEDDPLAGICAGQDFGLLTTTSGKVLITFLHLDFSIFAIGSNEIEGAALPFHINYICDFSLKVCAAKQLLSTSFMLVVVRRSLPLCFLPHFKSLIHFSNAISFSGLLHRKRYKPGL